MGVIITEPSNSVIDTTEWQEFISRTTKQSKGHIQISISNFDATTEPKIQAGSNLEVNGSYYEVLIEESITGWSGISNDTQDVFIKCIPAENACSFAFTTTAPTWSDSKQGWYATNDRYTNYMLSRGASSAVYSNKRLIPKDITVLDWLAPKVVDIGDWNMDSTVDVTIALGVPAESVKTVSVLIRDDTETSLLPMTPYPSGNSTEPPSDFNGVWKRLIVSSDSIFITRLTGGVFDSTSYDSTSYNRGWITIEYKGYSG